MDVVSVAKHYASLLAPVYLWMAGGIEAALAQGESDLATLAPDIRSDDGLAVDLGAGFGMHAIPLARAGWEVVAIDTSQTLLAQLGTFAQGLPVRALSADLRHFAQFLDGRSPRLVLCMGDTLAHLPDFEQVGALLHEVARSVARGGHFVATFRDHTRALAGTARFIPVRFDADRIMTCFVENDGERIIVHDVLHERRDGEWTMRVSAYPKLRLAPAFIAQTLSRAGLAVTVQAGPRGMVGIHARA